MQFLGDFVASDISIQITSGDPRKTVHSNLRKTEKNQMLIFCSSPPTEPMTFEDVDGPWRGVPQQAQG